MRKFTIITVLIIGIATYSFAQNSQEEGAKIEGVATTYDRIALTTIILENNSRYINDLKEASSGVLIPSKFDDNLIGTRYITAKKNQKEIRQALINNNVPNDIIAKWFARDDETGRLDMTVVHKRGMYNATDDEVKRASGSKLGLAKLKDAGELLINHSYILILAFENIQTMEEKYAKQDAAKKAIADKMGTDYSPTKRRKNGWDGDVTGYLYRLSFSDSIMNIIYNDLWIYDDDDATTAALKKEKFNQMKFPIEYVMMADGNADGSQYNQGEILAPPTQLTRTELFSKMINTGMSAIIFDIEREIEEFRVKTPLYGTKPLRSKIGKKEGVTTEQRFFVYEFYQNKKGDTKANRKGVIRAKNVIDNREVATGESQKFTTFYQTAGFGLMEGLMLQQRNDFGFGISGNSTLTGEIGGFSLKAEANLGIMAGRFAGMDLGITQLKVYGLLGFQSKEYASFGDYDDLNFSRLSVGLSKGWYFAHNFSFAMFAGYGMENAKSQDWIEDYDLEDDDYIGTDYIHYGAYLTLNVFHWMQIMGTVNMHTLFGDAYDKDRAVISEGTMYDDYFTNRNGMSIDLGIRIEF